MNLDTILVIFWVAVGVINLTSPFCGTNNAALRHDKDGFSFVLCEKDGCYIRTDGHLNDNAAVEAWNRRVDNG